MCLCYSITQKDGLTAQNIVEIQQNPCLGIAGNSFDNKAIHVLQAIKSHCIPSIFLPLHPAGACEEMIHFSYQDVPLTLFGGKCRIDFYFVSRSTILFPRACSCYDSEAKLLKNFTTQEFCAPECLAEWMGWFRAALIAALIKSITKGWQVTVHIPSTPCCRDGGGGLGKDT